jgi:predicted nucleic acid-binding protein
MRSIYFDASVILRWAFRQPPFVDLDRIEAHAVASILARVECWRTLDRKGFEPDMTMEMRVRAAANLTDVFEAIEQMEITSAVLMRALGPLPSPLSTLDAIHLVTALNWREWYRDEAVEFATHDRELARAARLHGFPVIGV